MDSINIKARLPTARDQSCRYSIVNQPAKHEVETENVREGRVGRTDEVVDMDFLQQLGSVSVISEAELIKHLTSACQGEMPTLNLLSRSIATMISEDLYDLFLKLHPISAGFRKNSGQVGAEDSPINQDIKFLRVFVALESAVKITEEFVAFCLRYRLQVIFPEFPRAELMSIILRIGLDGLSSVENLSGSECIESAVERIYNQLELLSNDSEKLFYFLISMSRDALCQLQRVSLRFVMSANGKQNADSALMSQVVLNDTLSEMIKSLLKTRTLDV